MEELNRLTAAKKTVTLDITEADHIKALLALKATLTIF
jgi:hypothetical protein